MRGEIMANNKNSDNRYIQILEIIYAIIFACAIAKMLESIPDPANLFSLPFKNWAAIIISVFVLIRFFFAPSKNIGLLVRKAEKSTALAISKMTCFTSQAGASGSKMAIAMPSNFPTSPLYYLMQFII